jgi:hypothetical protein
MIMKTTTKLLVSLCLAVALVATAGAQPPQIMPPPPPFAFSVIPCPQERQALLDMAHTSIVEEWGNTGMGSEPLIGEMPDFYLPFINLEGFEIGWMPITILIHIYEHTNNDLPDGWPVRICSTGIERCPGGHGRTISINFGRRDPAAREADAEISLPGYRSSATLEERLAVHEQNWWTYPAEIREGFFYAPTLELIEAPFNDTWVRISVPCGLNYGFDFLRDLAQTIIESTVLIPIQRDGTIPEAPPHICSLCGVQDCVGAVPGESCTPISDGEAEDDAPNSNPRTGIAPAVIPLSLWGCAAIAARKRRRVGTS